MINDQRLPNRFWAKIEQTSAGCWIWKGTKHKLGYGISYIDGRKQFAHRATYTKMVGMVGLGLELDHLCRERSCCNPAHLEPVSHKENMQRSPVMGRYHRERTHCPHGHLLDGRSKRNRYCKTCNRARYHRTKNLS